MSACAFDSCDNIPEVNLGGLPEVSQKGSKILFVLLVACLTLSCSHLSIHNLYGILDVT